jgi:predicted RNase H-like HicB family nuclease
MRKHKATKQYRLPVKIEILEEDGFLAICPILQGCHAEGGTIAEALENLEDVARQLLELREEDGLPIPAELRRYHKLTKEVFTGELVLAV